VTDRIEIGTGVVLAPLHHPLRLAEDAATVDCIAGGRFILGLGAGWRAEEFRRLGIPQTGLGRRMSETIRILRGAWGGEPFEFHGKVFDVDRTNVTPKPPRPIPIFVGGSAPAALRRAGRLADGFLASTTPLSELPAQIAAVREGLAAAGRDEAGFRYWVHEPVWVTNDPEGDIGEALRQYWLVRWKYLDMAPAQGKPSDPLGQPPPLDAATAATLRRQLIYGSPEQVAAQVAAFGEVLGEGGQFIARSYYPGLPAERSAEMIRLLGEVRSRLVA
jgi:probable F420-dependent oxidoreductase